jgi:D-arabinose 1-dehydrogenase-like Zn-dependent alcohol dehydrogenase
VCHSDVDHFRGNIHTSWGGAFPSVPGHEIVGRIDKIRPETAAEWGAAEGDRVAVREDRPADELTFFEPLSCAVT